jgi:hypothetical protein
VRDQYACTHIHTASLIIKYQQSRHKRDEWATGKLDTVHTKHISPVTTTWHSMAGPGDSCLWEPLGNSWSIQRSQTPTTSNPLRQLQCCRACKPVTTALIVPAQNQLWSWLLNSNLYKPHISTTLHAIIHCTWKNTSCP